VRFMPAIVIDSLVDIFNEFSLRLGNFSPTFPALEKLFFEDNKFAILSSLNVDNSVTAELMPSTLKRRQGSGPPRAPRFSGSRSISLYRVNIKQTGSNLEVTQSWGGFDEAIRNLHSGNPYMKPRPTIGFRPDSVARASGFLIAYLVHGAKIGDINRAAGL
jgi:hypothetical protein